mgnify:CR=1 FL=1
MAMGRASRNREPLPLSVWAILGLAAAVVVIGAEQLLGEVAVIIAITAYLVGAGTAGVLVLSGRRP